MARAVSSLQQTRPRTECSRKPPAPISPDTFRGAHDGSEEQSMRPGSSAFVQRTITAHQRGRRLGALLGAAVLVTTLVGSADAAPPSAGSAKAGPFVSFSLAGTPPQPAGTVCPGS